MDEPRRQRLRVFSPGKKIAAPPGTLHAPSGSEPTVLSVIAYDGERFTEEQDVNVARIDELASSHGTVWVNAVGLGTLDVLTALGDRFRLHPLALEDVLNVTQRPKLDDYGDHQFIVARMPIAEHHLETEQLSIFLGSSFVVTIQERPGDVFEALRRRLRDRRPRITNGGADYLVYAILDALVDSYFPLLEHLGSTLDDLEPQIQKNPESRHLKAMYILKHDLVALRRFLWPLRELNATLARPGNDFLSEKTQLYMRDCYDHSVHALELVESYRDIASGLMDLYLNMVSHRMNEVMKTLTIIATVFIPLSFVAGLYGMNFDPSVSRWNMPELSHPYGYPIAVGVMAVCAIGMLAFSWRKGWFR